jgi:BirA family biotin operon repressor/biotin-[acetyl-CoA-carboxylase] ligase
MSVPALPEGYGLIVFDEIDSTNEEARRRAAAGVTGPLWIVAHTQTAGRGRRGRTWVSPRGNLMATLLLDPGCDPGDAARLSFVAALAVHDALCAWVPASKVRLKWPNDALVEGRKVAGILLETASNGGGNKLPWLAIGIGINLVHAPEQASYPASSVNAYGPAPDCLSALTTLATSWDHRFAIMRGYGFGAIRSAWLERAAGLGTEIEVRLPAETIIGRFEGLESDGALELLLADGQRRLISAGEVFFPTAQG